MGIISDQVRMNSRLGTVWGFVCIVIGMLAIAAPFVTGIATTSLVAILMIAGGMTITVYCFKAGSFGKGLLQFLLGGITIIAGVAMLMMPVVSLFTLTGVLLAYFIADGLVTMYVGFDNKPMPGWGWVVFSGVMSILLGGLLWYGWPDTGEYAVGLLVGIRLLFAGWSIAVVGMTGDAVGDTMEKVGDEVREEVEEVIEQVAKEAAKPVEPAPAEAPAAETPAEEAPAKESAPEPPKDDKPKTE